VNDQRRDDDLIREVEELKSRLLALGEDDVKIARDTIARDLDALLRDLRDQRERVEATMPASLGG
jgi:hypothetical protein